MTQALTWAIFTLAQFLASIATGLYRRARTVRVLATAAALEYFLQSLILDMGEFVKELLISMQVLRERLPELHPVMDETVPPKTLFKSQGPENRSSNASVTIKTQQNHQPRD